jgi:hypothetical protein
MNTDIQKEILVLTEEWHELVCAEIHKDRDCHWYIESVWSYGLLPKYFVRHYGNIIDDIEAKCDTYEEALHALKKIIKRAIERQKELENYPKYNDW